MDGYTRKDNIYVGIIIELILFVVLPIVGVNINKNSQLRIKMFRK